MSLSDALSTLRGRMLSRHDPDALDNRDETVMEAAAGIVERTVEPYHRAEVRGIERVPSGGALYVGNHNSWAYMPETYLLSLAAYRRFGIEAVPYGLMHEVMLELPIINPLMTALGAVRASHDNGERLLRAGKKVLVFPGGDVESLRPFKDRDRVVFDDRSGFVRLALRTGVPIVPVVAAGAHSTFVIVDDMRWLAEAIGAKRFLRIKAWPLTLSMPWGITLGPTFPFLPFPSKILMEILEPVRFARTGSEAADDETYVKSCARAVQENMQAALTRLAAERRAG
ncbi:MAG: lysophospholipid acyltransferase family protein [Polyangiaceae bacterium]